jgi:PAS domain S-box-containing protein
VSKGTDQKKAVDGDERWQFQQLLSGVKDYAIFTLDRTGHVTSWNEGAENIKGYQAPEILGRHFSCFYEPQALAAGWPDQELKIAAGQGRLEDEGWRLRKDGTRFWASVVITALRDPSGELTGFLKITRDLTERRRHEESLRVSEERFRLLVEEVKDHALFMLDPQGIVASWNLGAERLAGYTAVEIMGRHFSSFYPRESVDIGLPQQHIALATQNGNVETEGWLVRKNGTRFWADMTISAFNDRDGRLRGFATVTRDLTERNRVAALEQSHESTYIFLAMLSHELRNPLAPLMTSVDILRMRNVSDPVVQQTSDVIARQVQHLTRLVDDLMDVSRITSGRIALSHASIDIAAPVARALELSRTLIDTKQHSLHLSLPEPPVMVSGDLTRLTQVMVNLLNNAAKYTPQGGHIDVTVKPENDSVVIRVCDTGSGMPRELVPRVFDLFTQGQRSLDRAEGGLGVGLTLVQKIVELHGGTVTAHSDGIDRGSEFVVRLPRDTALKVPAHPLKGSDGGDEPRHHLRILVVDDNRDAAESMAILMALWGHEVRRTYDGRRAIDVCLSYRPQVIFLDIGLPGMDGYEVAARLREKPETARTVLVAVTGYGQEEDRRRSRRAGFDHHLVKPVAPETLRLLLSSLEPGRSALKPEVTCIRSASASPSVPTRDATAGRNETPP